jgi:hypothetical protein
METTMNAVFKVAMASTLALATAAPAAAQYYQPTPQYQRDLQRYQAERSAYEARRDAYDDRREEYQQARADYERRRADWERARAAYDARWGYGAYARRYPMPTWDTAYWAGYPAPAYVAPAAPYYGRSASAVAPADVRCSGNNSTVTAGVIGALAGAVLGSNVAARNARTEGAVLGALVGGGIGAAVGNAHDRYKCDSRGPYFTRAETIPYREAYGYDAYRYRRYSSMGCRLATAPTDSYGREYRYVRVCPDSMGRYRITG